MKCVIILLMNKLTIYSTCGASGSGKSTFINKFAKENNLPIVCPDTIRARIGTGEGDQTKNAEVFRIATQELIQHLRNGQSVCWDATAYNEKNRELINKLAKQFNAEIEWHVFQVPLQTLIDRQKLRSRQVPDDIIKRQVDNMTIPNPEADVKIVRH